MSKVRFSAVLLSLILLISLAPLTVTAPANVSASEITKNTDTIKVKSVNVKLTFDGVVMQPPQGQFVFIYNNSTYVPLRFVSYALQKSVTWDAKNTKVAINEPSSTDLVVIKEYLMNATNGKSASNVTKDITLNSIKASYGFNGSAKSVPTGQSSYMLNGSLYVPLRFLSESVGNEMIWDQKSMTITSSSTAYREQNTGNNGNNTSSNNVSKDPSKPTISPTPAPSGGAASGGSGGTGTGKVSYETITSETEASLSALQSQSQSTLMSIALEYLAAKDAASKANIKANGMQQLASFTSSFNSILADAQSKLQAGGYDTKIIEQYRSAFEAQLQLGQKIAEGMAD